MWPRLVAPRACKTPCTVVLTDGHGEDGTPKEVARLEGLRCNWQDSPRQILDAERRLVRLNGTAFFNGDIAPGVNVLAGTVEIYGNLWTIYRSSKCRNPDGTVNYTKLELM